MGDRGKATEPDLTTGATPDIEKARVTVWEDGDKKTIEIDTGRRAPASGPSAQASTPETAGGTGTGAETKTKSIGDLGLIKALAPPSAGTEILVPFTPESQVLQRCLPVPGGLARVNGMGTVGN